MLESSDPNGLSPSWGQEATVKMQCVLEDRTVVEKDSKLVFVIGEGDVNQVNALKLLIFSELVSNSTKVLNVNFKDSLYKHVVGS